MDSKIEVNAYFEVFDKDGQIKSCGREKCQRLVEICQQIRPMEDPEYYGSIRTGQVNAQSIKELYEEMIF